MYQLLYYNFQLIKFFNVLIIVITITITIEYKY